MKKILLNYSIPLIITVVAIVQVYNVKTNHLTLWRGGGFGMYAAIYWSHREVWFFGLPKGVNPFDGFEREVNGVRKFPSTKNILALAEKVKNKYQVSELKVEVWEPRFTEDGTLSKVMLNRVDVPEGN